MWKNIQEFFLNVYPFVFIIVGAIIVPKILSKLFKKIFQASVFGKFNRIDEKRKNTLLVIINSITKYIIYTLALIMILKLLKVDLTPVLASAGVLTLIIGFSTQSILKDVFTGMLMVLENQISTGDVVEINDSGSRGTVEDVGLRTLGIREWTMRKVYIPYSEIKKIRNHNKSHGRVIEKFTLPYEISPDVIESCMKLVCNEMNMKFKDILIEKNLEDRKPEDESVYIEEFKFLGITSLNENSLLGTTYCITGVVHCDEVFICAQELRKLILTYLYKKNIHVSYPTMVLDYKSKG